MRIVAFAAVAALSAGDPALAQVASPCAALPLAGTAPSTNTVTEPAFCDAAGLAVPAWQGSGYVIPGPMGGGTLSYVDRFQGACQQVVGGAGTGRYRRSTICPPARQKVSVDGVWMCRSQAAATRPTTPRADCYAQRQIAIDGPRRILRRPPPDTTGLENRITVTGPNVGWSDIVLTPGAPAEFSLVRGPSDPRCMAPNCVRLRITTRPTTSTTALHTIAFGWPTGGAPALFGFRVEDMPRGRGSSRPRNRPGPLVWCEFGRQTCP
jgi:hypothetical protein